MGRFEEGAAEVEAARQVDPLSVRASFDLAMNFFFQRQYDRATAQLEKTTTQDPQNSLAHDLLGQVLWKLGREADAHRSYQKVHELERSFTPDEMGAMEAAFDSGGIRGFAAKKAELMERRRTDGRYQSALRIAQHHLIAGDTAKTLDWLERAVDERATWLPELNVDPTYDAIRGEPHFVALLEKIGFGKARPAP
jgi:tetratricopeptide (TPR) repeat protein